MQWIATSFSVLDCTSVELLSSELVHCIALVSCSCILVYSIALVSNSSTIIKDSGVYTHLVVLRFVNPER